MVERRLVWLALIVLVWGGAIFRKLVVLQVVQHQEYVKKARRRQEEVVELRAPRGAILDRLGRPLAMSVPTVSVSVDPKMLPSLDIDSDLLARELHLDPTALSGRIHRAHDNGRGFLWVKRGISQQESDDIRSLRLDWIHVDTGSERHYPNESLAAHVLGGVNFQEKGSAGIERSLDGELEGTAGAARILKDVYNRGIDEVVSSQPKPGESITLTIDEQLQFVAEREIAAAVKKHSAVSGSVVVMNPYTGDILAMASYPPYDPNDPPESSADSWNNHAISVPFEPGSVFKVITLSAALETTRLKPDSPVNCHGGVLTLPGHMVIHDSHGGLGILPMSGVLAHSSNVGAAEIGLQVGRDAMSEYMHRFGFGQKTGLPLPFESRGRVRPLTRWQTNSLAYISMGQEVSVTTLQLARAGAVIANGGMLVKPRLVLKEGDRTVPVEQPVRAIKPETAITMRQMMEGVVLNGTGKAAKLQGYTTGGKTGSAQIFDFATRRYTHTYNGSFLGFAPLTNPALVAVVTLNGTRGEGGFGGVVAAPVFKAVMTEAMRILDVPKDLPDDGSTQAEIAADVADASVPDTSEPNILEDRDDDDAAAAQAAVPNPPPGTVPNFQGMTLRAVIAEAQAKGFSIEPSGSGVARMQMPQPGAVLRQGERIRVRFTR